MSKMKESGIEDQQRSEDTKLQSPFDFDELSMSNLQTIILRLDRENQILRETELELHREVQRQEYVQKLIIKAIKEGGTDVDKEG